MMNESVQIGDFVCVTALTASCKECGKIAKGKGCRHASPEAVEAARRKLRDGLKEQALFQGDQDALGILINEIYRDVILYGIEHFRPGLSERDDDYQAVVVNLIRIIRERKGNFSPDTIRNFTRWVRSVAVFTASNLQHKETQYRSRRSGKPHIFEGRLSVEESKEAVGEQAILRADGPATEVCRDEMRELVRHGIERLKRRYGTMYSDVLERWALKNEGIKEIADALDITFKVARKRLEKARELLRELLRSDFQTLYHSWEKQKEA